MELAPFGIQVVILEPGIVRTGIFDENRRVTPRARDPESPYYAWFRRAEQEADALVRSSSITPADVARAVHRALIARRPRLRYVVGRRTRALLALKRHLPGEWFDRMYLREVVRRVTRAPVGPAPPPQDTEARDAREEVSRV